MIQKAPEEKTAPLTVSAFTEIVRNHQPNGKKGLSWPSGVTGILIGVGIGVAITLGGSHFLSSSKAEKNAAATPATTATKKISAQTVTVAIAKTAPVNLSLSATGTVAAFELIPVLSQASGLHIREILADEGSFVKKGQKLAQLDDAVLQARLAQAEASVRQAEAKLAELKTGTRSETIEQAKAGLMQTEARLKQAQASIPRTIAQVNAQVKVAQSQLNLAKSRYDSYQKLIETGAITRDQFNQILSQYNSAEANLLETKERLKQAQNTNSPEIEQLTAAVAESKQRLAELKAGYTPEVINQAEAQLAQAKAELQLVNAQWRDTQVVAPRSGLIAERKAQVGDITSNAKELFKIIEDGRLELLLKVPETQVKEVLAGQNVQITSDADRSLNVVGKVREIVPIVEQNSRQATVKVDLPTGIKLKPGMFLRGAIVTSSNSALTIPAKAVLPKADGTAIVYILQVDNTVKAQPIEMGEILPSDTIEIKSGIQAGEQIIVKGAAYLKDGDQVKVVRE